MVDVIEPRVPIGVRWGNPRRDSVTMVCATLSDPSSAPVVVSVGGKNYTVSMQPIGTDHPDAAGNPTLAQAGWVGNITLTGLLPFPNRNPYTVSQGSESVSGSVLCAPSEVQDFTLFMSTCDHPYAGYGADGTGFPNVAPQNYFRSGYWQFIRRYAQDPNNPPVAGVLIVDDTQYCDKHFVDDSDISKGGTGHKSYGWPTDGAHVTKLEYDYALAYFLYLGMYGRTDWDPVTGAGWEQALGRMTSRIWCARNIAYLPQWGDHEFRDGFGQDGNWTRTGNLDIWNPAFACYNAFFAPLQGDFIRNASGVNGDGAANHWALDLGCARIVCPDSVYNGSAEPADTPRSVVYGNAQIDDILAALDTDHAFKILGLAYQHRYLDPNAAGANRGASYGLFDLQLSEFQRLFTASSGAYKSVMANPKTNGTLGNLVNLGGDFHQSIVLRCQKPAYAGNHAENYYFVIPGTIDGSPNFAVPQTAGNTYQDMYLEHVGGWPSFLSGQPPHFAATLIEVYGSENPKRMVVRLMEADHATVDEKEVWSREFIQFYTDNTGRAVGSEPLRQSLGTGYFGDADGSGAF